MTKPRILIVDNEAAIVDVFTELLESDGYEVRSSSSAKKAMQILADWPCDVAFVDIKLDSSSGIELLELMRSENPFLQVILITGWPEMKTATEAIRLGACNYLTKPILPHQLLASARSALSAKRLADRTEQHRADLEAIFNTISDGIMMLDASGKLTRANQTARQICSCLLRTDCTVQAHQGVSPDCEPICLQLISKSLATGQPVRHERIRCSYSDPPNQVLSITTSPIMGQQGDCTGLVVVLRDETLINDLEGRLGSRKSLGRMIGSSSAMQRIYTQIEALADVPSTVLISGESGTGKELVAEALHLSGNRNHRPFVKVNCAALPENLLESELFGHVKGSFTGAVSNKTGRFQMADGGTIFLDEIGDISPALQMRLLRVLQEREFERVGDCNTIKVDLRVIAATNQDLLELVRQGKFREDLYYRLNVIKITLPPLRARDQDVDMLVKHFIERFAREFKREINGISSGALEFLQRYGWPGNVRELQHVIERACVLTPSGLINLENLPEELFNQQLKSTASPSDISDRLPAQYQLSTLLEALEYCRGNKTAAARLLGVSRRTLYRYLAKADNR